MSEEVIFVRKATGLTREVGWLGAMSLPICYAVGAGINFFAVQSVSQYPHSHIGLGLLLGGIPIFCVAAAMGLMAIAMPRTGGMYLFVSRTISPVIGFIATWGYIWACLMAFGIVCYISAQFWGLGFYLVGLATHNASLVALSNTLSQPINMVIFGLAIGVFWWIVAILGMRMMSKILTIAMFIPLIATLIGIGYMAAAWLQGIGAVEQAWNSVFGPKAWEAIMTVAQNHGWSPTSPEFGTYPMKMAPTWKTSIVAIWAYAGVEATTFIGSEVKNPSRNMIIGAVVAPIFVIVLYILMGMATVSAYGPFVSAYQFVTGVTPGSPGPGVMWPEVLKICPTYPETPMGSNIPLYQAVFAAPHSTLSAAIIAFATAFWLFNGPPAFIVGASRTIFACSFDRLLPERFASVNERFHSPHWAISFAAIVGLIYVVLNYYGTWLVFVGSEVMMVFGYLFCAIAALIFPFVRSEVWERGRRLTIAGVPVVSILGAIAMFFFFYQFWMSISGLSPGLEGMWWYTIFYTGLLLIVAAYYWYNKKRGIDIRTLYSEIPPV